MVAEFRKSDMVLLSWLVTTLILTVNDEHFTLDYYTVVVTTDERDEESESYKEKWRRKKKKIDQGRSHLFFEDI